MKRYLCPLLCLAAFGVAARAQVYMIETFGYPDGNLVGAPGSTWVTHSPVPPVDGKRLLVSSGTVFVHQPDTTSGMEDANRAFAFGGAPITFAPDGDADNNNNNLYSSFMVKFTALPNNTLGSYFGHFKSSAANEFYGRIGANLLGAAPGMFRLSIGNEVWNATIASYPVDLALGLTYRVVTRHNVDTGASTLWVDPADEASFSVTATDSRSFDASGAIAAYALRQGTSGSSPTTGAPGDVYLDNLLVGRTFASVIPEPHEYAAVCSLGLLGLAAWRRWRGARG